MESRRVLDSLELALQVAVSHLMLDAGNQNGVLYRSRKYSVAEHLSNPMAQSQ